MADAKQIFEKLCESFEGRRNKAYLDDKGIPTVGVGHTGPEVHLGITWTDAQIDAAFAKDTAAVYACIDHYVRTKDKLSPGTLAAAYDMAFNCGVGAFKTSTFLRDLNDLDMEAAKKSIMLWDKETVDGRLVVSLGLQRRRASERGLIGT